MYKRGKVLWWDKRDGQGIVKGDDGLKYYIDSSVILHPIYAGECVTFEVNSDIIDCLCAKNVCTI